MRCATRFHSELASALLVLAAAYGAAQAAAPLDTAKVYGFRYRLPEDWKLISPKAPSLEQQEKEEQKTSVTEAKKGMLCLEVPLTARHGDPPTTVVIDALRFDCYGQTLKPSDLQEFGAGAAEGLKETFDITTPVEARYRLAGHDFWIERARGTPRGKAGPAYTLEVVCTLLSRAAVCWAARAADEAGLHTFEQVPVTLDGTASAVLVPANVFVNNR
jgi:hypothetical protein